MPDIGAVTQIARVPVTLQSGYVYRIRTTGLASGVDPVMHLLDSSRMGVVTNDDYAPPDLNSQVEYAPPSTGTLQQEYRPLGADGDAGQWLLG